jgi:hypothetical protein
MKNLLKQFAMMFLFVLTFGLHQALAQTGDGRGPGRNEAMKQKAEALKVKLNLTEPQAAKYDEILKRNREEARAKMQELPEDASPSERRVIMEKALKNADVEIFEILDSEQQAIYKAEKEKMKEEVKAKRKKK